MSVTGGDDLNLRGLLSAVEIDIIDDGENEVQIDLTGSATMHDVEILLPGIGIAGAVGPTGPVGPSGTNSSVVVQDENITVVNAATALDFRGDGVTVTPGLAGEAVVQITGAPSDVIAYTHYQSSPSTVWTVNHPLTYQPGVTVVDSLKREVWPGEIEYLTPSTIRITFSASLGGQAYLS